MERRHAWEGTLLSGQKARNGWKKERSARNEIPRAIAATIPHSLTRSLCSLPSSIPHFHSVKASRRHHNNDDDDDDDDAADDHNNNTSRTGGPSSLPKTVDCAVTTHVVPSVTRSCLSSPYKKANPPLVQRRDLWSSLSVPSATTRDAGRTVVPWKIARDSILILA